MFLLLGVQDLLMSLYLGVTSGQYHRILVCQGSNEGQLHVRKVPYPFYYLSDPYITTFKGKSRQKIHTFLFILVYRET